MRLEILRALAELARDDGQLDRAERSYRALLTVLRRQEVTPEDAPMFIIAQLIGAVAATLVFRWLAPPVKA